MYGNVKSLLPGLAVRRACYGVLRFIMESGARGCEVVVSGKLRGQRAKSMKFVDGLMIHSGDPCNDYVNTATRHVLLRQGVLGIKVRIKTGLDILTKQIAHLNFSSFYIIGVKTIVFLGLRTRISHFLKNILGHLASSSFEK